MCQTPAHTSGQSSGPEQGIAKASAGPTQTELGFILRAMQANLGEFPKIELGATADRPAHLRRWRYVTHTALDICGDHVTTWWSWCWNVAEQVHAIYLERPIMDREGMTVGPRCPQQWKQLQTWIKPRVLQVLPQQLMKQLQLRGEQGIQDEVQDVFFALLKLCHPGAQDEKQAIFNLLQNPNPCSKAETALGELQRWISAARRMHAQKMSPPDVTILYTAMTSIFSSF